MPKEMSDEMLESMSGKNFRRMPEVMSEEMSGEKSDRTSLLNSMQAPRRLKTDVATAI